MKKAQSMTDLLRRALREAVGDRRGDNTLLGVQRATGLKRQSLTKFLNGGSLRLDKADVLAEHFGIVSKRER